MSSEWTGYNARHTAARAVAATFVVPQDFQEIARFQNSILIGPRGSGKTTILKVLSPDGLHQLQERFELTKALSGLQVDYLPIYIPADATWKGDTGTIREAIPDASARHHILNGIFVDHTLHWLVQALEGTRRLALSYGERQRPSWALAITDKDETNFSRLVSEAWKLRRVQTSFVGLKLALNDRINTYRSPITAPSEKNLEAARSNPTLDVFQMLKAVMDVVESFNPGTRWSFNFDEMEIAPRHVVSMLYENLRSWDQRAVLKFSLFPYVDFYTLEQKKSASETGPSDGPDYRAFALTNHFHKQVSNFTSDLIAAECANRGVSVADFAKYLNASTAIKVDTRMFHGVTTERNFEKIFDDVFAQKTDPALIEFLSNRGFDTAAKLTRIEGENARARHLRKIAPLAEFRSYYLSEQRAQKKRRSQRNSPKGFGYYHGYGQIAALTENNPRAVKYYVNDLLDEMARNTPSAVAQNRIIARNVDRFCALIASQIVPLEPDPKTLENPLYFADRLGRLFVHEVLRETFKPEPSMSVVFKAPPDQTKRIIEVAVNAGALVVDYEATISKLLFDVTGHRFRLSHSFAPRHPLPTITGPAVTISTVPAAEPFFPGQSDLFGWAES